MPRRDTSGKRGTPPNVRMPPVWHHPCARPARWRESDHRSAVRTCDPYAGAMLDIPLSALEVAMVQTDTRALDTLRDTAAFAQGMERLGYHRVWYAEHHH